MTRCLPALAVFFTMLSCVLCRSSVILGTSSTYFDFSAEYFQKFYECLCGPDSRDCSARVEDENKDYSDYESWLYYNVTNVNKNDIISFVDFSDRYECSLDGDTSAATLYRILCERQPQSNVKGPPASFLPCQSIHVSCFERCVDVLWSTDHSFWLRNENSQLVGCGSCELETSIAPTTTATTIISTSTTAAAVATTTTTTTKASTATKATTVTSTSDEQKGDDSSDDDIPLIVGVVVAVTVVLVIAGIIIVIWWRRKRNLKVPSTSHHYTNSTGAISQNYEETHHGYEHVGENVRSVTNPYVTADNESRKAKKSAQPTGRAVLDSHVSPEEVMQKKPAASAQSSNANSHSAEYTCIGEDMPYTAVSPEIGPYNIYNDNRGSPVPSSTTPATSTYSRLGEPARNIQNPYDALQNPDEYSVAKSTPANSNTSAQYSFAGPEASLPCNQNTETIHSSVPSSQPTNRNSYEEVDVNNMPTRPGVHINHYEEPPTLVYGDDKGNTEASKEPSYTEFQVKESENDYAKLGEPMRNIQNPYDVMAHQEENEPSTSLADDPYSLARLS